MLAVLTHSRGLTHGSDSPKHSIPLGESKVTVRQAPFESLGELAEADRYDLITSNIPFGDFMVYDRTYPKGRIASSGKRHAPSIITSSSRGWIAYERVAS